MIVSTRTTPALAGPTTGPTKEPTTEPTTEPTSETAKAGQADPVFAAMLAILSGLATPQQLMPTPASPPDAPDHPTMGAEPRPPALQGIPGLPTPPPGQQAVPAPAVGLAVAAAVPAPAAPGGAPTLPTATPLTAPPVAAAPPEQLERLPHPAHQVHPVQPVTPEHPDLPVQATSHETGPAPADPIRVAVPAHDAPPAPSPATVPADAAPGVTPAVPVAAAPPAAPAPAPSIVAATRHVPAAVVEAARKLHSDGAGRSSLVVRLDPPELGSVVVRLTVSHGRVDVVLRTPDVAAQQQLQTQGRGVLDVLASHGLDLGSFDVAAHDSRDPRQTPQGSPDRGSSRQHAAADGTPTTGTDSATDTVSDPRPAGTWL